jgi:hypothetical protein
MPKAASRRIRQWDEGKPLSFAWFDCASPDARRIYQKCNDDSRRASLRLEMQFQVLDDLSSGKLVAWGFQEGASLEQGPTPIPAHLFPRDAEDTAVIDWRSSTLKASSFFFDRIRVTEPRAGTPRKKRVSGPTSKQAKPSPAPSAIPAPTPIISKSPKKRGRPRVRSALIAGTMTYGTRSFALRWTDIPIRSTSPIIQASVSLRSVAMARRPPSCWAGSNSSTAAANTETRSSRSTS